MEPVVSPCGLVGIRHGIIHTSQGILMGIQPRWWAYRPSLIRVWWDQRARQESLCEADHCWLYFGQPRSCPGFVTLNYIRTSRRTSLATVRTALEVLDEIASTHQARAIVCHVSNGRLTDGVMNRAGFERHARHLPGDHFIKRYSERPHDGSTSQYPVPSHVRTPAIA
jgi:hypothetical protein